MQISPNIWKVGTIGLAAFLITALCFLFVAAPVLSLWNIARAAQARDADTFTSYIDYPKLRENLKADLNAAMLEESAMNQAGGIAALIGPTVINNMVDAYVTPAAAERMMAGGINMGPESRAMVFYPKNDEWDYGYSGLNLFKVTTVNPNGEKLEFTMERNNLIFWKLIRVQALKWKRK